MVNPEYTEKIQVRVGTFSDKWKEYSEKYFGSFSIEEFTIKFRELATRYFAEGKGMTAELALETAEKAALAIATHQYKVYKSCEKYGLKSDDPDYTVKLARIERGTIDFICGDIAAFVGQELTGRPDVTLDEVERILSYKPVDYEETAVRAYVYFSQLPSPAHFRW